MIRNFGFILLFFAVFQVLGQTIQVKEIESEFPIERVLIYNKNKTIHVYTDKEGKADISKFSDTAILFFQHLTYINYSVSKSEIIAQNKHVFLENSS